MQLKSVLLQQVEMSVQMLPKQLNTYERVLCRFWHCYRTLLGGSLDPNQSKQRESRH